MAAYVLFDNRRVNDGEKLEAYKRAAGPLVARFGGRYVVLGGPFEVLEGSSAPVFPVMLEFPDRASALAWYRSPEYQPLKDLRLEAVDSNAVLLDGLAGASGEVAAEGGGEVAAELGFDGVHVDVGA